MLKGIVGIVAGGGSGLGRGTVERFVMEGAKVMIIDLPDSKGAEVAAGFGKDKCLFSPGDITKETDVANALRITKEKFGCLHVNVNCAGIGLASRTYNFKLNKPHDLEEFKHIQLINLVGTFNVSRLSVGLMIENEPDFDGQRGVIINTSSIAAYEGQIGQAAYAASKAGIIGMTLPMARDLSGMGIRVNTISPGLFDTPLLSKLPLRVREYLAGKVPYPTRLGFPDEYAQLAVHIVTNKMINGEAIRIDGALRMQP